MATILIVDDDPMVLRLAEGTLTRAGHTVRTTNLAGKALEIVSRADIDALVLDVMMPGMSGLDLLEALRNQPEVAATPVLLMSALSGSDDRVRGLERGADDYLVKPFAPDELVLRVSRLLSQASRREPDLSGDLRLVSVPEVLQTLQHSEAHGTLEIATDLCLGTVELCRGHAVAARFGALEGREAVIALFEHETGRFRFNRRIEEGIDSDSAALPIQNLMFEAAWLRDELARRQTPSANDGLAIAPGWTSPPELGEEFAALPVHRVWQALELEPGLRVAELESRIRSAPGMAQLAIALLLEGGAVETAAAHDTSPGDALEVAARELVAEARRRRGAESLVQMLLVADEGVVGDLLSMRQEIPQRLMSAPGDSLMGAWRAGRIASLPLDAGDATLVVQMAPERSSLARQLEHALDRHAAVVIWSGDGSAPSRLGWLLDEVEQAPRPSWGLVVVPDRNATFRAALATSGLERWSVVQLRPTDLGTFLRAVRAAAGDGGGDHTVSFEAWAQPGMAEQETVTTA